MKNYIQKFMVSIYDNTLNRLVCFIITEILNFGMVMRIFSYYILYLQRYKEKATAIVPK